jgi:hypothetical protein
MHFSFNWLRIKGFYMFRALLAHPQDVLHKLHLVYWHNTHAIYQEPLCSASCGWASNARNMQRPLVLNKLNEKCITLVSLYLYSMMHGQQNIDCIYKSCISWRKREIFVLSKRTETRMLISPLCSLALEIQEIKRRFRNANTKPTGKQLPTFRKISERSCSTLRRRHTPNINTLQAFETPVTICHSTRRNTRIFTFQDHRSCALKSLDMWPVAAATQSFNPSPIPQFSRTHMNIDAYSPWLIQTWEKFSSRNTRTLFPYFHNHASQHTYIHTCIHTYLHNTYKHTYIH